MMDLKEAAAFFNENTFTDTYGTATFEGQVLPFHDSTRSGQAAKRRILEVSFNVSLPTKYTITEDSGQVYITAAKAEDYFGGDIIRVKYPILPVFDQYNIRTIGQILTDTGGVEDVYAVQSYIRRSVVEDQSDYFGGYQTYFSPYFTVSPGQIIEGNSKYYRAREESRVDDVGFGTVESVLIESPLQTLTFQAQGTVYDPDDDDYTPPAAIASVNCFIEHIQFDFMHEALGFQKIEAGDKAISFLKSQVSTVVAGDAIGDYKILTIDDNTDFWTVHGRKL